MLDVKWIENNLLLDFKRRKFNVFVVFWLVVFIVSSELVVVFLVMVME